MSEALITFFQSGEFWPVLIKVLLTALLTGIVGLCTTLIGKIVAKNKNSAIMKQAEIAVKAAEQKYPNEGKKMGAEKMAYVMDYLAITFPKIKSNQYLYNIAEAAVYELNNQAQKEEAKKEFEEKYGELPAEETEEEQITEGTVEDPIENSQEEVAEEISNVETQSTTTTKKSNSSSKLNIF